MANRMMAALNDALRSTSKVEDYYSRRYLCEVTDPVDLEQAKRLTSIDMYYRVHGYELYDKQENNHQVLTDLGRRLIGVSLQNGDALCYSIHSSQQGIAAYYGCNHRSAEPVKQLLQSGLFQAELQNIWVDRSMLQSVQMCGGVLVGACGLQLGDLDRVLGAMEGEQYLINTILLPYARDHVEAELRQIDSYLDRYRGLLQNELTFGSGRVRRFTHENHDVLNLIELLEGEKQRLLEGRVGGLWQVMIHISAAGQAAFDKLAALLVALYASRANRERSRLEPRVIPVAGPVVSRSIWRLPDCFLGRVDLGGLYGESLFEPLCGEEAASLTMLPLMPHMGFLVRHLGESRVSAGAFDQVSPHVDAPFVVRLGRMKDGGEYALALNDLRQHVFVAGATRFGKSTSVWRLLSDARAAGIPFLVIESVKKEYWRLIHHNGMHGVKVYSAGMDARPLHINPFEPEPGTILDTHIQHLIQALVALIDQETPLPQLITELVYTCYERRGWDTTRRITEQEEREFPMLADMLTHLEECLQRIGYGEEVHDNMRGVVRVRIGALLRGQMGETLVARRGLCMRDLFRTSAVVELDDLNDRNRSFLASILAIKANEYARQSAMDGQLARLLVVEEAHHILPNPELKSISQTAGECSHYFANMLAEISAYGTGVVVVDQRPSAIASAALANSGIKIIHNLREGADTDAVTASMRLQPIEAVLLNKLAVGEAIVSVPQSPEVCRIHVDGNFALMDEPHLDWLFCDGEACGDMPDIGDYERAYLTGQAVTAGTLQHCVSSIENRATHVLTGQERLCLAGQLCGLCRCNELLQRQALYEFCQLQGWLQDQEESDGTI